MKEKNKTKGITLIALVITIIVLVILAGVSVSAIINKGIISNTKIASDKYNEKTAEEKLAVTLAGAQIEKYSNKEYNQEFFLTQYIQNALVQEGVVVNGNFVIFNDGNVFEIDRSVPKIVNVIGKREKEEGIIITGSEEPSDHYTKAIVSVKASYEEAITKIIINGEEIIPTVSEDAYTVSTKVSKNGSYGVIVYAGDKYNYATIQVTVISEDMIIRTVDEFKTFRDKVNAGATFEGKTITLINDIDLNEGKYTVTENGTVTFESDAEQWIPIGTDNTQFSGTFDGQCNTIRGIYIYNNNKSRNGLFDTINEKGSVKNIILDMLVISNTKYEINGIYIGAVAAINNGVIERCQIKSNSNMFGQQEYLSNSVYIGGIVGENTNVIKECINNNL